MGDAYRGFTARASSLHLHLLGVMDMCNGWMVRHRFLKVDGSNDGLNSKVLKICRVSWSGVVEATMLVHVQSGALRSTGGVSLVCRYE